MTTADRTSPSGVDELDGTWARDVRWWDAGFYVIAALSVMAVAVEPSEPGATAVVTVSIGVMVVAYLLFGRRAARTRRTGTAVAYLLIAIAATTASVTQNVLATLLLFAVFSQIWMLLESRWVSSVLCVVLSVSVTAAITIADSDGGFDPQVLARVIPQMGIALVFSLGLGLWVAHTLRQSERYARLVDALHTTRAELAATSRDAGALAERERISREIHDTLAQGFTSIVMLAQAASADLDRDAADDARARLELVESTARDNLAEARALVAAHAPVPLWDATLAEAVGRVADRFAAESGVTVSTRWGSVPRLSSTQEVVVLRCAQEALANVRKHAAARHVTVSFGMVGESVALEVTDDGRGLDPGEAEGFGLRGMRDRVAAEGGSVRIAPGPAGGTSVVVELPVSGGVG